MRPPATSNAADTRTSRAASVPVVGSRPASAGSVVGDSGPIRPGIVVDGAGMVVLVGGTVVGVVVGAVVGTVVVVVVMTGVLEPSVV